MHSLTYASREIGIDMAHRVFDHGSKCKNIHGHRYRISATIFGALASSGEERGMVMDFGFLKDLMMVHIDERCDHGLCLWVDDPAAAHLIGAGFSRVREDVKEFGDATVILPENPFGAGKITLLNVTPTAENLAMVWHNWLAAPIFTRSNERATLGSIKVYETPNCSAEYVTL